MAANPADNAAELNKHRRPRSIDLHGLPCTVSTLDFACMAYPTAVLLRTLVRSTAVSRVLLRTYGFIYICSGYIESLVSRIRPVRYRHIYFLYIGKQTRTGSGWLEDLRRPDWHASYGTVTGSRQHACMRPAGAMALAGDSRSPTRRVGAPVHPAKPHRIK